MKSLMPLKLGRCFLLLPVLLLSVNCSSHRIGDRGDCQDISDGMSQYDVHVLRSKRDDIDSEKLLASLESWNSTTRFKSLLILISNTDLNTLLPHLRVALQDKDPRVRAISIEGLTMAAESQAALIPELLPILTQGMQDEDPGIRLSSVLGLIDVTADHQTLRPQLLPLVADGLKDSSACVRAKAVARFQTLIGRLDSSELEAMIPHLITVVSSDSSVWARRHALDTVRMINIASEKIIPAIVTVLKDHPDLTVRSAAAYALETKEITPASVEALIEAINHEYSPLRIRAVAALVHTQPDTLMSQDNLSILSDQGLRTAIWYTECQGESKDDALAVFHALVAERDSRLNP